MKTFIGSAYFNSFTSAVSYWETYGFSRKDVAEKIRNKEIFIERPPIKPGQKILLNKEEGRYFIQENY
jgi:hypothetical protein